MNSPAPLCIAVDWGTSNLRVYLVALDGHVIAEKNSDRGMLTLKPSEFEWALKELIQDWFQYQVPVLLAGMVGSRGGWQEVPYLDCPLLLTDLSQHLTPLPVNWPVEAWIVPGVKAYGVSKQIDVMRGEETQLLGLLAALGDLTQRVSFCMPGTHCKWGTLDSGRLSCFSTSITGELFALLSKHSSLTKGILDIEHEFDDAAFDDGVSVAQQSGGLLHQLFSVRSRWVTGDLSQTAVRSYLSGLIIGSDVIHMLPVVGEHPLYIIGSDAVSERYQRALSSMMPNTIHCLNARTASLYGFNALSECMVQRGENK